MHAKHRCGRIPKVRQTDSRPTFEYSPSRGKSPLCIAKQPFSNCSVATFSEGGGPRSGSADSGSDPACGLAQLYVLRLPTQARPRGISPSPSAGTRFPQVAGMDRPARLPAQKLQASAAWTICIAFAHFPLVRAPSATSSPNLVDRWIHSRRLPLVWSEILRVLADIAGCDLQSQVSSENFVGPLPATRAVGRCEATDAIPTGARRRRPISRRSGRIPAIVCVVNACASVRLCRSLPSFAFHLASPVICRERAPRRERDGSMQLQPSTARTTV